MVEANVKILQTLKGFIAYVTACRERLEQFCVSERDFLRQRKLPFRQLVLLLVKLCKKTLSVELEQFFFEVNGSLPCSVSAFTQQRLKLQPGFLFCWNVVLQKSYLQHYGAAVKRWKGYRLLACDGSTVALVNTPALKAYFGAQANQITDYVTARTFYHYDVLNEIIVLPQIAPYHYGELNLAYAAVEHLPADTVSLYDRNFSYYKMVALHLWQEQERKFVIRAREKHKWIAHFIRSGAPSQVVEMKPTQSARSGLRKSGYLITPNTTLAVRLVRVEIKNTVEVLITNLWEEEGHPAGEFKDLYALRWGVETNISVQKNILQLESFSGLSVCAVLQDFFATVFTANLHALLVKDAQQTIDTTTQHRKHPLKVNKNKSFGKLKTCLVALFIREDLATVLQNLHDCFVRDPVPVRSGRTFKRWRKNTRSASKYKTFTNFKPAY
jgi:hypothetical protein